MRIYGLEFTPETVDLIHQWLDEVPAISKRALARCICESMNWKASSGRLKEAACRKALMVLEEQGIINLPISDAKTIPKRAAKPRAAASYEPGNVACALSELGCIEIKMVTSRYTKAATIWRDLMDTHHYLGSGPLMGAQIRYLVHSPFFGYIGAASFSSAAWALRDRDDFIGWTEAARHNNLQRLICNSRFLIVPTVQVPNLASHVLSQCAARITDDWIHRYGIEPVALETFIDPERFSGTSYRAANWISVGQTSGRRAAEKDQGPKEILFYPLRQNWQQILCKEPLIKLGQKPRPAEPADWVENELGTVEFYDPRLKRRLFSMVRDFYSQPEAPIPQACQSHAKTKAAYRFLHNNRVDMDNVLRAHVESTVERIKSREIVLAVQDSTSLNYTAHAAMQGLGPINNTQNSSVGLLVHDTMAFTPQGTPLGLLDVQCWARDDEDRGKKYRRKKLSIEEKESMKWLNSYQAVCEIQDLCPNTMMISVGDREADVYELFMQAAEHPNGPELLIRCERSRKRKTQVDNLWQDMGSKPVAGIQVVHIPKKGSLPARDAKLEIRHAPVTLKPPQDKSYPALDVWMVYAREIDPPDFVKSPLDWMLLTTVPVHSFEQACERLMWYTKRWGIEVYHRTLKSGCRIEDRRLETADSLESCLAIDMIVAWRVYHLTQLGREVPDSPCTVFFEEAEWKALYVFINKELPESKEPPSLEEAMRMTASLGGFLNRKGDGFPGPTTLWRGIDRLGVITSTYISLLPYLKSGP